MPAVADHCAVLSLSKGVLDPNKTDLAFWLSGFLRFWAENLVLGAAADGRILACCHSGLLALPCGEVNEQK